MKRKIVTSLLVVTLVLSLAACGNKDTNTTDTNTQTEVMSPDEKVDYSKVVYEEITVEVTDEMVNNKINEIINSGYRPVDTDRTTVGNCDIITVTGTISVDGEVYSECNNEKYNTAMPELYLPGFIDNMIGTELGSEVEFTINTDDILEELQNKDLVCKLTIVEIKEAGRYEADDELAKACGYDDFATFRDAVARSLEILETESAKEQTEYNAVMAYATYVGISVNEDEKQTELDRLIKTYTDTASSMNMTYEEYIEYVNGGDVESFESNLKESVIYTVTLDKVVKDLINRENLQLSDEEFNTGITELANMYGCTTGIIEETFSHDEITELLLRDKVVDTIVSSATKK